MLSNRCVEEMNLPLPEYVSFLAGYIDAVARAYTDDEFVCASSASLMKDNDTLESLLSVHVEEELEIENMARELEGAVASVLGVEPKDRLLFYLIEYMLWFKEFYASCECRKYKISSALTPDNYFCYVFNVNNKHRVLVAMSYSKKEGVGDKCVSFAFAK